MCMDYDVYDNLPDHVRCEIIKTIKRLGYQVIITDDYFMGQQITIYDPKLRSGVLLATERHE